MLKELEDEDEDYVNIKELIDRVIDEFYLSICCYINCVDFEFEKYSGKEFVEFIVVKDIFNNKIYIMLFDFKIYGDFRGEKCDEDLRFSNNEEIKVRLVKYK